MQKREMAIYIFVALSSLLVVSYTVHMLIGGLVSEELETQITIGVTLFWACLIIAAGFDIAKRRGLRN